MLKCLCLFALLIFLFLHTVPAFCGVSKTMTFQVTATLPEHVMSNNANLLAQTQTVIRNNKTTRLTSIVVL